MLAEHILSQALLQTIKWWWCICQLKYCFRLERLHNLYNKFKEDIYNYNEIGLCLTSLPDNTIALKGENVVEEKYLKCAILFYVHMNDHFENTFTVRKASKPCAFYKHQY